MTGAENYRRDFAAVKRAECGEPMTLEGLAECIDTLALSFAAESTQKRMRAAAAAIRSLQAWRKHGCDYYSAPGYLAKPAHDAVDAAEKATDAALGACRP